MTPTEAETPQSDNRIDSIAILRSLLLADRHESAASELLAACLVVGAFWLIGLTVPELVAWIEREPQLVHWTVFVSSAVLAFRALGVLPIAFVQYLFVTALVSNGLFLGIPLAGSGGSLGSGELVHPDPVVGLLGGLYFAVFFVPVPLLAGFVLGRLGRVVNARCGPLLDALRDAS